MTIRTGKSADRSGGDRRARDALGNGLEAAKGALAEPNPEQWTGTDPDVAVRVRGVREDGSTVIEGVIRLWVTARPR